MVYVVLVIVLAAYARWCYSSIKRRYRNIFQWTTKGYGKNNGYIYFFRDKDSGIFSPIKIGRTNDIRRRLREHRTATTGGVKLVAAFRATDDRRTERKLHQYFADSRVRRDGEWFGMTLGLFVAIYLLRDKTLTERNQL